MEFYTRFDLLTKRILGEIVADQQFQTENKSYSRNRGLLSIGGLSNTTKLLYRKTRLQTLLMDLS